MEHLALGLASFAAVVGIACLVEIRRCREAFESLDFYMVQQRRDLNRLTKEVIHNKVGVVQNKESDYVRYS